MENPNYYSIIPADVRYDTRLTPNAKLLYAEITALANMNGKCFATNDYFAKLYCVSKTSISKWVSQLVEFGYIQSEIIYKNGSKEIENRYLTILKYPTQEKFNTPPQEKFKDNNTTIVEYNNTLTESKIREALEKWISYKKERKQSYKPTGLKACIEKLEMLSNNNPDFAMRIVNESISNNWSGLFPLKNNKEEKERTFIVDIGKFYIDDSEKYSPEYSDLASQLSIEKRNEIGDWFFQKFNGKEIKLSFIRNVLKKAIENEKK